MEDVDRRREDEQQQAAASSWRMKMMMMRRRRRRKLEETISFSARLPSDVGARGGAFAGSLCAVKYSVHPFKDIRDSIVEMILHSHHHDVLDWKDMEDLIHSYLLLNPSHLHHLIKHAFLSLTLLSSS